MTARVAQNVPQERAGRTRGPKTLSARPLHRPAPLDRERRLPLVEALEQHRLRFLEAHDRPLSYLVEVNQVIAVDRHPAVVIPLSFLRSCPLLAA